MEIKNFLQDLYTTRDLKSLPYYHRPCPLIKPELQMSVDEVERDVVPIPLWILTC